MALQAPIETMEYNKDKTTLTTVRSSVYQGKNDEYTQHSEIPYGQDSRIRPPNRRSFIEKLGMYNIYVLVVGAVAIFAAMAFLSLLWSGSETARHGRPTPAFWFDIVRRPNWATRVVTVGSVLVRLAAGAQMGLVAALLAAWILETTGASAEHLPLLSIIRTVNNGPQSHIWNVGHAIHTRSKRFYSALIILAIIDALALQFTSTLLVTDFGHAIVVPQAYNRTVAWGLYQPMDPDAQGQHGQIYADNGVDLNLAAPPAYPRFAEFTVPNTSYMGTDYADTGETYRAFLPIGLSDTRGIVRRYEGPATVFDSRVRCTRPSMSITNVTYMIDSGTGGTAEIIVIGDITMDGTIPGLTIDVTDGSGVFMSTPTVRIHANSTDWRLSYGALQLGFVKAPLSPIDRIQHTSLWSLLLLNVTGDWSTTLESIGKDGIVGPYNWTQEPAGLWTNLKTTNETIDIGISATVCFVGLETNDFWVRTKTERDFVEPRNMSWVRDTWKYDTTAVRRMLGATQEPLSLNERGVFDMEQPLDWDEAIMMTRSNYTSQEFIQPSILNSLRRLENPYVKDFYGDIDEYRYVPQTAALTPFSWYNSVNRALSAPFQDIMQTTGNPALAFQALFTTMSMIAYYQALPLFSLDNVATMATSTSYSVPVRWTGFSIVMGLLVIHSMLVITAVYLFLSKTGHSLLGNAWQAVAQVSSSDTMDTMHHASNMTDLEVRRMLRMNSYEDCDVVLKTGADTGRSQAVYRRGPGDS